MNGQKKILTSVVLMAAAFAMVVHFGSQASDGETAVVQKPTPSTAPAKAQAKATTPVVDYWSLAVAAYKRGELELASDYCVRSIVRLQKLPESIALLRSINLKKSNNQIVNVDKENRRSIKKNFDAAERIWEDYKKLLASVKEMDAVDEVLSDSDLRLVYKTIANIQTIISGIQSRRFYAFHDFAWVHINKARQLRKEGKSSWYWDDDESKFIDALVELNIAWSVAEEISKGDRNEMVKLHDILKSELNKDQYTRAMNRSKSINGK
jgi:hypothetical protein